MWPLASQSLILNRSFELKLTDPPIVLAASSSSATDQLAAHIGHTLLDSTRPPETSGRDTGSCSLPSLPNSEDTPFAPLPLLPRDPVWSTKKEKKTFRSPYPPFGVRPCPALAAASALRSPCPSHRLNLPTRVYSSVICGLNH